jgi:tungstate transport system ATP-binding protein
MPEPVSNSDGAKMSPGELMVLSRVQKHYGSTRVIDLFELVIEPGQTFCLLGPTGAGKSTLLRMMAGLESPSAGSITWRGASWQGGEWPRDWQLRISLVFQHPLLLSRTVRANVEYGLRLRQQQDTMAARVAELLDQLGLTPWAEQSAQTLSGGQIQLVALARALVLEPEILLLDEPTAHLDPAYVSLVEQVVRERCQKRAMTIVWTTHNLFQARRVADRVGLMLNGQLIETARMESFFHQPSDTRTRDFIEGRMIY